MAIMKFTTKMTTYNSDFDENGNISAKSLLSIFQDVASRHAEEIGVGFVAMLEKNFYWVLSRVKFDIVKMPSLYQDIIVETWPHEKGRIDFDRDFKISDENGEILVKGTSKWCVIDTEKRSLQRAENVNYFGEFCPDINYDEKFSKIVLPDSVPVFKFTHTVRFSDLDPNKHMNNTKYADLAINAADTKVFSHFEINYLNECLEGDEIKLSTILTDEGEFIIGTNQEKTAFVALIKK